MGFFKRYLQCLPFYYYYSEDTIMQALCQLTEQDLLSISHSVQAV